MRRYPPTVRAVSIILSPSLRDSLHSVLYLLNMLLHWIHIPHSNSQRPQAFDLLYEVSIQPARIQVLDDRLEEAPPQIHQAQLRQDGRSSILLSTQKYQLTPLDLHLRLSLIHI